MIEHKRPALMDSFFQVKLVFHWYIKAQTELHPVFQKRQEVKLSLVSCKVLRSNGHKLVHHNVKSNAASQCCYVNAESGFGWAFCLAGGPLSHRL